MNIIKQALFITNCLLVSILCAQTKLQLPYQPNYWEINEPVFLPGESGSFDEIAVKDPTIIFFENYWHLFYTARNRYEYTTGYVSAKELEKFQLAERYELTQIRGKTRYGCAPQVFYFEPEKKWYLIFQNGDANYQPAFSTTKTISKPNSWSNPKSLLIKDNSEKWIDFWIIADEKKVFLFYTKAHNEVIVRSTDIINFPYKWSSEKKIFEGVHEAIHVYKVKDKDEFHLIYELNNEGIRSFGMAVAENLDGPWKKETDKYACGEQLHFKKNTYQWTEMVSHGEVLRSGYNQFMEYEPDNCSWIIQGIMKQELLSKYEFLPWKLGIIKHIQ